jgi:prepilin-type N-terminal cleavage/methylation domain-containing protein
MLDRREGFTLLEILVAAVILAMVMTMAVGFFQGIQRASAKITEGRPRDRAVRVILDRFERELSGAILMRRKEGVDPLSHPWIFYAQDGVLEEQDADRVRFVTQTPLHSAGELHGRGVRIVSYGLELGENGLPRLLRSEEELGDQLVKGIELGEAQIVAEDVAAFSLRFMGENGARDDWDSTAVETDNLLPLNVEVVVQLWQRDADGQLVPGTPVTRLMEIPTRPEFLEPPEQAGAECETGISVRDCRDQWLTQLQSKYADSPDALERVQQMFSRVTDACWAAEEPSSELQLLKDLLANEGVQVPACPTR